MCPRSERRSLALRAARVRAPAFLRASGGSLTVLNSVRGRAGGIRLGRAPAEINLGALIRETEDGFDLVDCGSCVVTPACSVTGVLGETLGAFLAVLDRYTLADMLTPHLRLRELLLADRTRVEELATP